MTITRFSFPTPIHFGAGARKLVAAHLLDAGIRRPLIVELLGATGMVTTWLLPGATLSSSGAIANSPVRNAPRPPP